MPAATRRWPAALAAFALVSIVVGAALRFTWPSDIEFKHDERFMFERSQRVGISEPWPTLGMPSGVGLRNAGLSIWVFVALARALDITTPDGLAMAVTGLSVVALGAFYVFAIRMVAERERAAWLWGVALAAVSPLAVTMERKIWAQSVFPVFVAVFWLGWWRRERVWGAFVWGLVGALLGQVHMSGLFFCAGVFAWELVHVRRATSAPRPKWIAWLVGSALGAVPMIPWVLYLVHAKSERQSSFDLGEIFTPRLWYFGATDALGLGLETSLGATSFADFLRAPWIGGTPTYAVAVVHVVLVVAGVALLANALRRAWTTPRSVLEGADRTGAALRSVWLGYGALMTLSGALLYRHYLVVTFPCEWVLVASVALAGGDRWAKLLPMLWVCQLVVTIAFLVYVHTHHGALGDYGIGLRWQTEADALREPYR